jgi:hypothetical protein
MPADRATRRAYLARSLPRLEQTITELDRHEHWAAFAIDCDDDRGRQLSELVTGRPIQTYQRQPVEMASLLPGQMLAKLSYQVCKTCTIAQAEQICARGLPELLPLPDVEHGHFLAIIVHKGVEAFVLPIPRVTEDLPDLDSAELSRRIVQLLPAELCRELVILPLDWRHGELYVAAAKWDDAVIDRLNFTLCGHPKIRLVIRSHEAIARAIEKYFGPGTAG